MVIKTFQRLDKCYHIAICGVTDSDQSQFLKTIRRESVHQDHVPSSVGVNISDLRSQLWDILRE